MLLSLTSVILCARYYTIHDTLHAAPNRYIHTYKWAAGRYIHTYIHASKKQTSTKPWSDVNPRTPHRANQPSRQGRGLPSGRWPWRTYPAKNQAPERDERGLHKTRCTRIGDRAADHHHHQVMISDSGAPTTIMQQRTTTKKKATTAEVHQPRTASQKPT